jgi:hypothetical protein
MKALKNESTAYMEQIVSAVQSCYAQKSEPTNAQLTVLYSSIGKCICQQGEKAFVAHLAKLFAEQLPQIGGFSMRNLRRMRDFYRTYENQPELMHKAQTLGWTQNAVILDCCETDAQRSFYMKLAAEKKLSKLALMKAIATGTFEAATEETVAEKCDHCCAAVGITTPEEAVDTTDTLKAECGAFVTTSEPFRQGDALLSCHKRYNITDYDNVFGNAANPMDKYAKRLSSAAQKATELVLKTSIHLNQTEWWWQLLERPPKRQSPPFVALV